MKRNRTLRPRINRQELYRRYEAEKQEIYRTSKSSEEVERRVIELAKKYGL